MTDRDGTSILEVRDLRVSYGKVEVLHGVSIGAREQRTATIIGPNGAGKSTLVNAVMGCLPAEGKVLFRGEDITHAAVEDRVDLGMNLVPENRALFPDMSVRDNLLLGCYSRYRRRERHYDSEFDYVFELFPRLKERLGQQAATLSGGERQMLAVGRALMARPKLLILDEPSLGLAPRIVRDIFAILQRLGQQGLSTLLIEQNARAALKISDYGYVLETGELVTEGPSSELAANPRIAEAYLGLAKASSAPV
jgi:branched-chain amino acid transport system ATP-binding protein